MTQQQAIMTQTRRPKKLQTARRTFNFFRRYGRSHRWFIRCCRLGSAMTGSNWRVLLEEPAAGNRHGGVCEGGDIPNKGWKQMSTKDCLALLESAGVIDKL